MGDKLGMASLVVDHALFLHTGGFHGGLVDADVLFDNPNWAQATAERLEQFHVVQPFGRAVRLRHGETWIDENTLPVGSAEHESLHGMAWGVAPKGFGCLERFIDHGHSGYAWAARRQLLERHGLYQCNILGNADLNMAHAMFAGTKALRSDRLSERAIKHLKKWAHAFHDDVQGSVGYVEGTLFHLWHGEKADRLYNQRLRVLVDNAFDPEQDLAVGAQSGLVWDSDKPDLHAWCANYFAQRREDP